MFNNNKKNNDFNYKLMNLEKLLMTLENREIKFNIVFSLDEETILNICDKSSKRQVKEKKNDAKKKKEEEE